MVLFLFLVVHCCCTYSNVDYAVDDVIVPPFTTMFSIPIDGRHKRVRATKDRTKDQ